jgi:hypothetical protein
VIFDSGVRPCDDEGSQKCEDSSLCLRWILALRRANQKVCVDLKGHADVVDRHGGKTPHCRRRFAAKASDEDVGIQEQDYG